VGDESPVVTLATSSSVIGGRWAKGEGIMGATVARAAAGVESELRTWHRATIGRNVAGREDPAMPKVGPRIDAYIAKSAPFLRLEQTIAWLAEGKSRSWKYQKK
jgi:hypothetical protein